MTGKTDTGQELKRRVTGNENCSVIKSAVTLMVVGYQLDLRFRDSPSHERTGGSVSADGAIEKDHVSFIHEANIRL